VGRPKGSSEERKALIFSCTKPHESGGLVTKNDADVAQWQCSRFVSGRLEVQVLSSAPRLLR
jgi:hypothetical protein